MAGDPEATDYEEMSERVGITRFSAPAETILDIVKDTEPGMCLDNVSCIPKLTTELVTPLIIMIDFIHRAKT